MPRLDYEALVSGLPDALVGVDADIRVVLWNPAAEELLGRSARRVIGRPLKEVFPPDTSLVRHLTDTLATGESRSESSAVIEGQDGRPVRVSIVTAPLAGRSGAIDSAVAVVRDITRLHQLESEVRRGETLAAAGQMAVGLAHEIRNPLSAIRGAVQLLQRELGDEARWGEYTDVLLKEVTRVNGIIEMLLDLSRPVTLRAVPLNVHQLLERVALLLEEMAAARQVSFVRRYDPSLPPSWPTRIASCRSSTTSCAMPSRPCPRGQAHPGHAPQHESPLRQGGPRAGPADHGRDPGGRRGGGHSAATREKLFTPFFTTKDRGLGLGLALCHRIVEEHKGAMQVTSEPGHGTAFSCFLPITK